MTDENGIPWRAPSIAAEDSERLIAAYCLYRRRSLEPTRALNTPEQAAALAWMHARPRHLRAPRWDEAHALNTGARRSYYSPLGLATGLAIGAYGQHSGRFPRTEESKRAGLAVREMLLDQLEKIRLARQKNAR